MDNKVKYSIHANPLKDAEGRTTYQVRQDIHGTLNTRGLLEHMHRHQLLGNIPVEAVLETLRKEIVEHLLNNVNVHLDGLGTFYLNIGFRPLTDDDGNQQRRVVTDPATVTGNDLCVTGLGFMPDKEFQTMVTEAHVSFEHAAPRGTVGHSEQYTLEEMAATVTDYLATHDYITRRSFQMMWHLTYYASRQWLQRLTEGPSAPLRAEKVGTTLVYRRNTA